MMKIAITKIVIDESIYPRSGVSSVAVARLVSALKVGNHFPPLVIEAKTYRLVSGRHRYEAYLKEGIASVDVEQKVYVSDADLFADAVRFNISHGLPLDQFSIKNAIIRLEQYGYERHQISEIVRLPPAEIEKITRGFASDEKGEPLALKGGLGHMRGKTLDPQQMEVNRHYSGGKAVFYVRQLIAMLENNMTPSSAVFADEMDRLVALWRSMTAHPSRPQQPHHPAGPQQQPQV
jgi:ParB/Sulfiredoxin domain